MTRLRFLFVRRDAESPLLDRERTVDDEHDWPDDPGEEKRADHSGERIAECLRRD